MSVKSWLPLVSLVFALAACSGRKSASIEVSGLNYTNAWITEFAVDGYGGHGISPNGGGGAFVCCVTIPRKWQAGMKVKVRWIGDDPLYNSWKERLVEVPRYTVQDIGVFAVHFYADDTVKVLVTTKMEGHPDYPYPRPAN
ncbi:DUF3304 domain-containing protein [Massilia consociata]|uniref:DUF3304 domain-containing protein n=1 Tax=Massilia consociata TaxID=760117 RepID=A0ABV6FL30_9BURK